jgi:hypothetical protein
VPLVACEIDPVIPPGDEVAVYEVIAAPPLDTGAVNETFAVVAPVDVAVTEVGAPGDVTVGAPIENVVSSDQEVTVPDANAKFPSVLIVINTLPTEMLGTLSETTPVVEL